MKSLVLYPSQGLSRPRSSGFSTYLGIHHTTCTNCIKKGDSYLNFFKITNTLAVGGGC
jgi:hypothetical protein